MYFFLTFFLHLVFTLLFLSMCSPVLCLRFVKAEWKDVVVGDMLRIHKDQVVPVRMDG